MPIGRRRRSTSSTTSHPEWLAQRGAVTLTFSADSGVLERRTETTPGWKRFAGGRCRRAASLLQVSADSAWSPRAAGPATTPGCSACGCATSCRRRPAATGLPAPLPAARARPSGRRCCA